MLASSTSDASRPQLLDSYLNKLNKLLNKSGAAGQYRSSPPLYGALCARM